MLSSSGRKRSVHRLEDSIRRNSEGLPIVGRRDECLLLEKLVLLETLDAKSRPSASHSEGREEVNESGLMLSDRYLGGGIRSG